MFGKRLLEIDHWYNRFTRETANSKISYIWHGTGDVISYTEFSAFGAPDISSVKLSKQFELLDLISSFEYSGITSPPTSQEQIALQSEDKLHIPLVSSRCSSKLSTEWFAIYFVIPCSAMVHFSRKAWIWKKCVFLWKNNKYFAFLSFAYVNRAVPYLIFVWTVTVVMQGNNYKAYAVAQ